MHRKRLFVSRVNKGNQDQAGGEATGLRVWDDVQLVLASRIAPEEFDRWIAELRLVAEVDGEMLLAAKDRYALDRAETGYKREIERLWAAMDPLGRMIKLICSCSFSPAKRG
jgi:chromosomal replication initiator protein